MQQLSKLFNANVAIILVVLKLGPAAGKKKLCFDVLLFCKETLTTKRQQRKLLEYF
jgi:hypothetical protein